MNVTKQQRAGRLAGALSNLRLAAAAAGLVPPRDGPAARLMHDNLQQVEAALTAERDAILAEVSAHG